MKFVYVLFNGGDPEDIVIFLTKEEAINASLEYPDMKVQIFQKYDFGYQMAYIYYMNGKLYEGS